MKILVNIVLSLSFAIFALTTSSSANALERLERYSNVDFPAMSTGSSAPLAALLQLSQNGNIRSRSDVISDVKKRYKAEVLRINLNEKRMVYEVRVLMPNGKVKNITVNARR